MGIVLDLLSNKELEQSWSMLIVEIVDNVTRIRHVNVVLAG